MSGRPELRHLTSLLHPLFMIRLLQITFIEHKRVSTCQKISPRHGTQALRVVQHWGVVLAADGQLAQPVNTSHSWRSPKMCITFISHSMKGMRSSVTAGRTGTQLGTPEALLNTPKNHFRCSGRSAQLCCSSPAAGSGGASHRRSSTCLARCCRGLSSSPWRRAHGSSLSHLAPPPPPQNSHYYLDNL